MQRLADCFAAINGRDVTALKAYNRSRGKDTPRTRAYLREHCRANQLPIQQQLVKADRVMAELVGTKDPVTQQTMVSKTDMQNYTFQRQLVENEFLTEPLPSDAMHLNVTKTSRRTGKTLMPRWYALGGEQKLEALWRELKDILQSIGTYGPTLAVELLMTARMVEHNQHTDNLVASSTDLGTTDMSLVLCILQIEEQLTASHPHWAPAQRTFAHVKLNSFLMAACRLPRELIHACGVQDLPNDSTVESILKEDPIIHHVTKLGADEVSLSSKPMTTAVPSSTAQIDSAVESMADAQIAAQPVATSLASAKSPQQTTPTLPSEVPLPSSPPPQQNMMAMLPPPSPARNQQFSTSTIETGRQAYRKVPGAAKSRRRAQPALGEISFPIETEAERSLAWDLVQQDMMRFPSGEPKHDKILSAFNAKVGSLEGIRPKTISDIRQYFANFALGAAATQFMETAQSSVATPARIDNESNISPSSGDNSGAAKPMAVAKPISNVTGMGGSRSNKGESLRCKCGDFMSSHIIVKLRQEGVCSCPDGAANCAAKWVRDSYVCPKDKKNNGDGAEAVRMALEARAKQQAHRRAREQWRLKNRVKRPKTKED
jgi:hypothetical protein